jgi:hypothetical protein
VITLGKNTAVAEKEVEKIVMFLTTPKKKDVILNEMISENLDHPGENPI